MSIFNMNNLPIATVINLPYSSDNRGTFIKTFSSDLLAEITRNGIEFVLRESYYTFSKRGVIRGMHFQLPPHDHHKLVHVISGKILDTVLDIRKNSPDYGKFFQFELSAKTSEALLIPSGFAHGFCALEDSTVQYYQTTSYAPKYDSGIRYDSFGLDWKNPNPIISERDLNFDLFNNFITPF